MLRKRLRKFFDPPRRKA